MNACESVRQNGRRVELRAQGYSAFHGQGRQPEGSRVRRLGAALPIFQKGGKLEQNFRRLMKGPQCGAGSARCGPQESR